MKASEATPGNLLLKIRTLLPSLNEQEQKVGQYVLSHPDRVVHFAIGDLAAECLASNTTIFRFCRKIGAAGYQDFKIRLAQTLTVERTPIYATASDTDTLLDIATKAVTANIKALEDTLLMVDIGALEETANAMLNARRVDIYGAGGGAIAALDLQYKLMRLGVRAVPHVDAELQIVSATLLTSADVAVAISHSGESQDVLRALQVAAASGATTIAITNHPTSAIAHAAQISLHTGAQEALAHGYPLGARVAQVGLIDVLYACMAVKRQTEVAHNHARIAAALQSRQG